jgi:hypothetical protein
MQVAIISGVRQRMGGRVDGWAGRRAGENATSPKGTLDYSRVTASPLRDVMNNMIGKV